jgi:hypothetical protein
MDALAELIERLGLNQRSYSRAEAAEVLGMSERQLDRVLKTGALRSFAPGQRIITIARNDLGRYLLDHERGGYQPVPKPTPRRRVGRPRTARK